MAPRKSERILNLTICLLSASRYLSKERIRAAVEGYAGLTDAAFERTFERDKDDLRRMGVPLEMGSNSSLFDDEFGYRIRRSDFELPPVEFSAEEAAVVALAAQTWQQATLADSTRRAMAKLRAAGLDARPVPAVAPAGAMTVAEPAFDALWNAVLTRSRVEFDYRGGQRRRLEPWIITTARGRWYVTGYDLDRAAPRMFRLSRIVGDPVVVAGPEAFEIPADVDPRQVARSLEPADAGAVAELALRTGAAPALRRRGEPVEASRPLPPGFDAVAVRFGAVDALAGEVAALGTAALVVGPAELREAVVARLTAVAALGEAS